MLRERSKRRPAALLAGGELPARLVGDEFLLPLPFTVLEHLARFARPIISVIKYKYYTVCSIYYR
jgi:hypothetical protein